MIPAQKIVKALAAASTLFAVSAMTGFSQPALAQGPNQTPIIRSSGPILTAGGETVMVCAANNQLASLLPPPPPTPAASTASSSTTSVTPFDVTLQVVNGISGTVLAQRQITLQPLGAIPEPPDPCLSFTAPTTFALSTNLFVIRVALNPQPLPPGLCSPHSFSVSLQIYTPDSSGNPTSIRTLTFEPPDPCERPT